ncbi:MAG TPA: hypothetical protein PLF04_06120 [Candidatus Fermentibacter daniensis]|jgi:hypothetical protein|nr:hypothetical protein [Candidatus Fermentibacter sp.]HOZ17892.1 hypothetical protein [Candidatus Fermentibacter daniensis]
MGEALLGAAGLVSRLYSVAAVPAASLSPVFGLALLSVLTGIPMAEAFRLASPRGLDSLMRQALSRIAGMILHVDDPVSVIRLALSSLWRTLVFLAALLLPMLLAAVPFMVSYGQIESRFGRRMPGDTVVVIVGTDGIQPVEVRGDGVEVLLPVVRGVSPQTVAFRAAVAGRGTIVLDGREVEIGIDRAGAPVPSAFSTSITAAGLLDPSVRTLTGDGPELDGSISLEPVRYRLAGIRSGWLVLYIVFSSLGATAWFLLAMRRRP